MFETCWEQCVSQSFPWRKQNYWGPEICQILQSHPERNETLGILGWVGRVELKKSSTSDLYVTDLSKAVFFSVNEKRSNYKMAMAWDLGWFATAELDRIVKLMGSWMGGFKHFPKYVEFLIIALTPEGFPLWRNIIAMNTDKWSVGTLVAGGSCPWNPWFERDMY